MFSRLKPYDIARHERLEQQKLRNAVAKSKRARIPFLQREKAAYLILRRKGLSINQLSKAFGRSTSVIHRILVKAQKHGHNLDVWRRNADLRKLARKGRLRVAAFLHHKLLTLLSQWEAWITGEEGEPP